MAYEQDSVEGKYRCNHPESDFVSNSNGPIQLKKEKFVEYTHRNETANYQYDVWNNSNNTISANYTKSSSNYSQNTTTSNSYSQNRSNYASRNSYNYSNNRKQSSTIRFWIIFALFFLPGIFEILAAVLNSILNAQH